MPVTTRGIREILALAPVIPVLTITDAAAAVPLARVLLEAGLPVLEVTLRTAAALEAIEAIASEVPETIVGAGTVLDARQFSAAVGAGSRFVVSPGFSKELAAQARVSGVPLLPGAVTATEIMAALSEGLDTLKFFPAAQAGGASLLKAFSGPFGGVRFCPTGGIDVGNAHEYLGLGNVLCVGMSSIAPAALIDAGDFRSIGERARAAAALPRVG
jgi:2-dehydro-3-deoxyphosphogluconate aldolase / (4S)-4-hydroxy-2-oxoglutarate aldolase